MFRILERYWTAIVIFLVITMPVFVYRANAVEPATANTVDRIFLAASAPLKHLMSWATGAVSDAWYSYVDVFRARKEYAELHIRLVRAERARDEAQALVVENQHLRKILQIRDDNPSATLLPATVIGAGTSPIARTIEVDRGAIDGVVKGMVVISDEGLVGVVSRVGWTSADVMLIADEKFTLSVLVMRSRARGRVKGNGLSPGFALELTEVLRADDARIGDRVATSGLGGVFPGGIPVGEITMVRTPTGAQHRVADVEPYVDFARLEHVMILVSRSHEEPLVTPEPLRPATLRGAAAPLTVARDLDAGVLDGAIGGAHPRPPPVVRLSVDGGRGSRDAALEAPPRPAVAPDGGIAGTAGTAAQRVDAGAGVEAVPGGAEPGADPGTDAPDELPTPENAAEGGAGEPAGDHAADAAPGAQQGSHAADRGLVPDAGRPATAVEPVRPSAGPAPGDAG